MVCKEEVLSWFKDLESYKRIDVLYDLLNMCIPFELRFLGTCMEEIGKHTYQELRGPSITANDFEKLSKDLSFNQGLLEETVRHRVLLFLSLLSSRNCSVADWFYKKVLRTDYVEEFLIKDKGKDELLLNEFLLLFTMALHHPAFTFDQKQEFYRVLTRLIDYKESKSWVCPKPSVYGYPPGFGYPTEKKQAVSENSPTVPVKSAVPVLSFSDTVYPQPPGLPHMPPQQLPPPPKQQLPPPPTQPPPPSQQPAPAPIDFISMWSSRPGFPCGAPEVPPFPTSPISPLVNQLESPSNSRSTSPHRTPIPVNVRPPPPVLPPPLGPPAPLPSIPLMEIPPPAAIIPLEPLSQSSLPVYGAELKLPEEELSSLPEEKHLCELPWPVVPNHIKPNGFRFAFAGKQRPYLVEQMQSLSLDGENALHQSNSSSNSSPNHTPPGTPLMVRATSPQRGTTDSRVNGIPAFGPPPPLCDATSPPPPAPFSNCTVPYNYPPQTYSLPPNRSMFSYTQPYRPPPSYTAQFHSFSESYPAYTYPYLPNMFSSVYTTRNPSSCFNCGAAGHVGTECTAQNIEEITQKKTYQLDFSPTLPDAEK